VPKLDYPKILTNKDWQSKKAVLDKVGKNKKTGVGDELDLFEKAYLKTDFAKPSDGVKPTTHDPLRFQAQLSQMRQHFMNERKKVESQYLATDKKIDAAIKTLGAGSNSGKHLAKIKAALSAFRGHDMAEHIHQLERASVKAYVANLQKSIAFGFVEDGEKTRKNVAPYKKYLGEITSYDDIEDRFHPNNGRSSNPPGRAFSTMCQNWDQFLAAEFPDYSKKFYSGTAMDFVRPTTVLYTLATPGQSGSLVCVEKMKALNAGSETERVAKFKKDAQSDWAAAEKFVDAFFRLVDTMPKDLKAM
jgi:hypothetical protein